MIEFNSLVGKTVHFYGVDNLRFKLGIRDKRGRIEKVVFEAIENDSDGLRSYLDSIVVKEDADDVFFRRALGKVKIVDYNDHYYNTYRFVDDDNHCWLEIGTYSIDDYYPSFEFRYSPKDKA